MSDRGIVGLVLLSEIEALVVSWNPPSCLLLMIAVHHERHALVRLLPRALLDRNLSQVDYDQHILDVPRRLEQ